MPKLTIEDFRARQPALLDLLRRLVEMESPTEDKAAIDRLGEKVADEMARRGAKVEREPQTDAGDHWVGRWGQGAGGILMMCHLDTVHPQGTLAQLPWHMEDDRLFGPGVMDMKGGLALALVAVEALRDSGDLPERPITLLCTSDEECGSDSSRPLIESLAAKHSLVLCLEPGMADGSVKTWRKGIGVFTLEATGRAAHAGVEPEKGVNAIVEASRHIPAIMALQDLKAGTTINLGVIQGGTYSNVVPAKCRIEIDVRVLDPTESSRVERGLFGLKPSLSGAEIQVSGGWNRPPMPRTEIIGATFEAVRAYAQALGIELTEGGTGGGSDANFVAPLGVPVLDGLGPVGGGAHSLQEHLLLSSLAPRTALLAAILTDWPSSPAGP